MNRSNEDFSVLNAERIHCRSIFLPDARTAQDFGGVVLFRMILKTERERAPQRADHIVVRLLRPAVRVSHLHERGVANREEGQSADGGAPDVVEDLAMRRERDGRQVLATHAGFLIPAWCVIARPLSRWRGRPRALPLCGIADESRHPPL